ncbi:MAG TPA: type 1 glutamine amidotransferase [Proteobacteria bacterium]|nr:type 1 glutamine amidotransferase [Pseudomonadota bacterium]
MSRVAILIEDNYQVLEAWYPYLRLREEGIETVFVGTGRREYRSKEGYVARQDVSINDIDADDFDGVIIPGGYAPDLMRRNRRMVEFVRRMHESGKLVAAICHAGWMLVSADIIRGRKVTGFFSIKDDLENAGARLEDAEVVVDGNILTSRNPFDLPAFTGAIIAFLKRRNLDPMGDDG